MKTSQQFQLISVVVAMLTACSALAYPGESIVKNANGDYTITYQSSDDNAPGLMTTVFVPSTKITPTIRSTFRLAEKGTIIYGYTVSNGAAAKQSIVGVLLENIARPIVGEQAPLAVSSSITMPDVMSYSTANNAATPAPTGWHGTIVRDMSRVAWRPNSGTLETAGIKPGHTLMGFGFASLDLPGVSVAKMDGLGAVFGYPDEGPAEDSSILNELNQLIHNDFIAKPAAVPMVAVPSPFDAGALLNNIQTQMHTWIGMKLLDPTFSSQLDRYLTAAAEAYRHNQLKAAREDLEKVREMLKKEHQDLGRDEEHEESKGREKNDDKKPVSIDRLAARVLDFDLMYVQKRTRGERED